MARPNMAADTPVHDDHSLRAMQARQMRKIEQLREVFLTNGRLTVREHAKLLGLCPSTAHAILQRNYKSSGLSAAIIKRMLACPDLPERARTIILEYKDEKIAGLYGHTRSQRLKFMTALVDSKVDSSSSPAFPTQAPTSSRQDSSTTAALRSRCNEKKSPRVRRTRAIRSATLS